MQTSTDILARLSKFLPMGKDVFTDPDKLEERLFRSGVKPDDDKPVPRRVFRH